MCRALGDDGPGLSLLSSQLFVAQADGIEGDWDIPDVPSVGDSVGERKKGFAPACVMPIATLA